MDLYDIAVARKLSGGSGGGGGSSDFSTAEVTIINNSGHSIENCIFAYILETDEWSGILADNVIVEGTAVYQIPIYKGANLMALSTEHGEIITVSGDIETDESDVTVTGNGTITIS